MAKRRKKKEYDDYEDWQDADTVSAEQEPEVVKVSLEDFVVKEKVHAFINSYEPCKEFDEGAKMFDDGSLREYFKAYVCGLGDPLNLYIEDLKLASFRMVTSLATNEPAIFVRFKKRES